jgi:hypothetical protein
VIKSRRIRWVEHVAQMRVKHTKFYVETMKDQSTLKTNAKIGEEYYNGSL